MAKRTNRVVWGLAAILSVVVLGGAIGLLVSYQSRLPKKDRWVMLLPKSEWGFGPDNVAAILSFLDLEYKGGSAWPKRYRRGIVTVRVECSEPAGPRAATGSSTEPFY